ncbi:MAG: ABC transporter permease [Bdellovibrionales bacterium]|nr:ABC transporter permease [Bdellovibrionales bacterium]
MSFVVGLVQSWFPTEIFARHFRALYLAGELIQKLVRQASTGPYRKPQVLDQMLTIGVGSLPIITIATGFTGLVMTSEIAWHMDFALSNVSMIPGFTGQFVLRELGIAIPALLIVSKVGASMTAELASMRITEQLDAFKLLKIDVVSYHIYPRWVATIFSTICLTMISIAITLLIAMFTAVTKYHFNSEEYFSTLSQFITSLDLICALTKATVFGAIIPPIACAYGLKCEGGAQGVGQATTDAVVTATLAVILLDFVMTAIFSALL